jgi:gamma-D-glutamyl-L-lysine dipeptidyl-peptidase
MRLLRSGDVGYATSGRVAQVSSLTANLYRETDVTQHRPVLTVPFETRLEVVAQGQGDDVGWVQIRLPDQSTAWIQAGDVDFSPRKLSIEESIALG